MIDKSTMGIVVHTADKLKCSEFFVFVNFFRYHDIERPSINARVEYRKYCDGQKLPEDIENFCIDVMTNRININMKGVTT